MEAKGIIVAVDEVTLVVSAGLFVKKPHSNGIRRQLLSHEQGV